MCPKQSARSFTSMERAFWPNSWEAPLQIPGHNSSPGCDGAWCSWQHRTLMHSEKTAPGTSTSLPHCMLQQWSTVWHVGQQALLGNHANVWEHWDNTVVHWFMAAISAKMWSAALIFSFSFPPTWLLESYRGDRTSVQCMCFLTSLTYHNLWKVTPPSLLMRVSTHGTQLP